MLNHSKILHNKIPKLLYNIFMVSKEYVFDNNP